MDLNDKYLNNKNTVISIIKYLLIVGISIAVFACGLKLLWILFPVLIGFTIAFITNSLSRVIYRLFCRKNPSRDEHGKDTKGYTALKIFLYFSFLALFVCVFIFIITLLIAQLRNLITYFNDNIDSLDFIDRLSDYIRKVSDKLGGFLPASATAKLISELDKIQTDLVRMIPEITGKALNIFIVALKNIPSFLFRVIVTIMAGYYFIADRISIDILILKLLPSRTFVRKMVSSVNKLFTSFFRIVGGYIIIMIVTFFEALIGLLVIRMPYAVIIAVVIMFCDLLPLVGAGACFVPISIYMFVRGDTTAGFIALGFAGLLTFVRSAMEPKVVGTATKLHPIVTFTSMLLGTSLFGFPGFIGGPLFVIFIAELGNVFGFTQTFRKRSREILNKFAGKKDRNKNTNNNTDVDADKDKDLYVDVDTEASSTDINEN